MTFVLGDSLDPILLSTPHPHPTNGARYGWAWSVDSSKPLNEWFTADYASMYRTQPSLRRVVDFIARNLAQLPIHVFDRVSDTDRVRVTDHPLAVTLATPNPARMTRYRWMEAVVADLCLFDRSWTVAIGTGGTEPLELYWLPAALTTYDIEREQLIVAGLSDPIPIDTVIHFAGYSPNGVATPPCETLRAVLAEDRAATEYRSELWTNGARIGGWIGRPSAAPDWSDEARARFRTEWHGRWAAGSSFAGGTPVLEEGMEFHAATMSATDAQYIESRKLTIAECASAYQVPPPMVGVLENANYASTKEFRKALYQDTLGPWIEMLTLDLERQLLPRFDDTDDLYVEMAFAAKLAGSFDEQAELLTRAVGAPWMLRSEARARMNLPFVDGSDELVVPLNVITGGQPAPNMPLNESGTAAIAPPVIELPPARKAEDVADAVLAAMRARIDAHGELPTTLAKALPATRDKTNARLQAELATFFTRQERKVVNGSRLDLDTEDPELAAILERSGYAFSLAGAATVLRGNEVDGFDADRMKPWLAAAAANTANSVNTTTVNQLASPGATPEAVFDVARSARVGSVADSWDCTTYNFGGRDAARSARRTTKSWRVTSGNPRSSHAELDGETVGIEDVFSNGAAYPGDPSLPVEERARCSCVVEYQTGGD